MKLRSITSVVYVIVIAALLVLKWQFPFYGSIGIDVLFWLVSIIGAYEFLRAVKDVSKAQYWTSLVSCAIIIPSFVISKMTAIAVTGDQAKAAEIALLVMLADSSVGIMVTASLLVFDFNRSNLKSTAYAITCILYCGVLTSVGPNINHFATNSYPATMFLFFLTAFVDTCALLVGKLLGKALPLKLAPHTSPNKTVIGSIGGIIGGVLASVVVYFMCVNIPGMEFDYNGTMPLVALFIILSIPAAIFAQLGDLFESAIKRGCGIKDMGKCLPGHGGVLDRFDSTMFAAVAVVVLFMIIR